jgi:hypothetical protein
MGNATSDWDDELERWNRDAQLARREEGFVVRVSRAARPRRRPTHRVVTCLKLGRHVGSQTVARVAEPQVRYHGHTEIAETLRSTHSR